ncbi:hypothetical protein L3X38_040204 [Prunus dulcis]|uniref:Uncharacterized protein n=1 Tax=Prunus dulcis TaxID=3755 RepID=A0AAD4YT64_PRUDU|nr:hypothetical protein L3X38_040204 [Prunus dulcis]
MASIESSIQSPHAPIDKWAVLVQSSPSVLSLFLHACKGRGGPDIFHFSRLIRSVSVWLPRKLSALIANPSL